MPAALGAPLLLIGTERHAASAPPCSRYLVTLAMALRHAFRMVYRPNDELQVAGHGKGMMNWRRVSLLSSQEDARSIERAGDGDFIASLVAQD